MGRLLKWVIVGLFSLLFMSALLFGAYIVFFGERQISFLSLRTDLRWRVDKAQMKALELRLKGAGGGLSHKIYIVKGVLKS
jgi:hypothetical protein